MGNVHDSVCVSSQLRHRARTGHTILTTLRSICATTTMGLLVAACHSNPTSPAGPGPAPTPGVASTAAFTVTFNENPVPFRNTGCNASVQQGWYTTTRVQETAGVSFTPNALVQKLDGIVSDSLAESFSSRFASCAGGALSQG